MFTTHKLYTKLFRNVVQTVCVFYVIKTQIWFVSFQTSTYVIHKSICGSDYLYCTIYTEIKLVYLHHVQHKNPSWATYAACQFKLLLYQSDETPAITGAILGDAKNSLYIVVSLLLSQHHAATHLCSLLSSSPRLLWKSSQLICNGLGRKSDEIPNFRSKNGILIAAIRETELCGSDDLCVVITCIHKFLCIHKPSDLSLTTVCFSSFSLFWSTSNYFLYFEG